MALSLPPTGEAGEDRYQPLAEINVTPMVDVMLVLLIIFMVTAPLLTVGVPLDLPKTSAAQVTQPKEPIVLSLDREGGTFIGNERVEPGDLKDRLVPARRGRSQPHRLCEGRPDDQLCPADGCAGARQQRRVHQGVAARRGGSAEVSRSVGLPLAASIAGHACILALLIVLVGQVPPVPLPVPIATAGIEVMLAPPQPVAEMPPPALEPPAVPEAEPPPARAAAARRRGRAATAGASATARRHPGTGEAATGAAEAGGKAATAAGAHPTSRTGSSAPARTGANRRDSETRAPPPPTPTGPIVSAGYRAALSAWLESHKRYPDSARARGEEGRAVLRFHVDRAGRVLNYAVVQGTGYPDLDAAIDQMMRGASLPPFPADMSASDVDVSVTIRFALAR